MLHFLKFRFWEFGHTSTQFNDFFTKHLIIYPAKVKTFWSFWVWNDKWQERNKPGCTYLKQDVSNSHLAPESKSHTHRHFHPNCFTYESMHFPWYIFLQPEVNKETSFWLEKPFSFLRLYTLCGNIKVSLSSIFLDASCRRNSSPLYFFSLFSILFFLEFK